jgi:protein ImuB
MPRIACLLVPDFPVAAVCRADPDLAALPLALTDGDGPHAPIVAASKSARARGVKPGRQSATQARAVATDLVVRRRDPAAEDSATRALLDVAASLASRIEPAAGGVVYADADGATHLTGTEAGFATALVTRAERVGLEARVGLGASMTVARLAALRGDGCDVGPAGGELGYLAPLPLACLEPDAATAATLARWGVRLFGDLARLPAAEVATRLGQPGVDLLRAARGEDPRPLAPVPPPDDVAESISLDHPVDNLEPLLFVLRGLAERAVDRLGLDGIGCRRLALVLDLDDRSRDARTLPLAAPTRDVKTLLTCLRVALEATPPRAAVLKVTVLAVPERVRATQLDLFAPAGPAPERLATTLARLGALCGVERVGTPVVVDTHRPGVAATAPFTMPAPDASPPGDAPPDCRLVIRTLRPPRPLQVFSERDAPCFVRGQGLGGRVVGSAGPWRVTAEWWSSAPVARDYYDLELTDGGIYRCFREHRSGGWFVDGVYD